MHPHSELISTRHDPTDLVDVLPDSTVYWVGFTMQSKPIPFNTNLLLRYRCAVARLHEQVLIMISSRAPVPNLYETWTATEQLARSMAEWYSSLPEKLVYRPEMPTPLFECKPSLCQNPYLRHMSWM